MKSLQSRLERLETALPGELDFLTRLYSIHNGQFRDFGDMDHEEPSFASIDDLRKHYVDQGFKEVDIYVFKMPGTMPNPLARPTPKVRSNIKRILIYVMGECDYVSDAHYPNTEEFARMKEKYDNI